MTVRPEFSVGDTVKLVFTYVQRITFERIINDQAFIKVLGTCNSCKQTKGPKNKGFQNY